MGCPIGQNSFFNTGSNNYIKFQGSDLIAIEGSETIERQLLGYLRFPYKQILRGRVILKAGQVNYLMNHLGLGDNATFVSIVAKYDDKSKIEEDNYVQYNYYPDLLKSYFFSKMVLLTGNSTNRVPQLYLTNPNATYPVILDVMVAVLDDTYNYFNDVINQSGVSFTGLSHTDIETFIPNSSIVILDTDRNPLAYIDMTSISSFSRNGKILIIIENSFGSIYLDFISEYEAEQASSLLYYIWNNLGSDPAIVVDMDHPYVDNTPPTIYFNLTVGSASAGYLISMDGSTQSGPYDTNMGTTFSTNLYLTDTGTYSNGTYSFTKQLLNDLLIKEVIDNKDGSIILDDSTIILSNSSLPVSLISSAGLYEMKFNVIDYANNMIDSNVSVQLNVGRDLPDTTPPIIYFNQFVGTSSILLDGLDFGPYDSTMGTTFSVEFSLVEMGTDVMGTYTMTKLEISNMIVNSIVDDVDGNINMIDDFVVLSNDTSDLIDSITSSGTYSMSFIISDTSGNYVDTSLNIRLGVSYPDLVPPILYFQQTVASVGGGFTISLQDASFSPPYNTSMGITFSTEIPYTYGAGPEYTFEKIDLINMLVDHVSDDVDGTISIDETNINLINLDSPIVDLDSITSSGTYSMSFNISDTSGNVIDTNTSLQLRISYPEIVLDTTPPIMYFLSTVGSVGGGVTISLADSVVDPPYDTTMGYSFSTSISISDFGPSELTKNNLIGILISEVVDDFDGVLSITESNIILTDESMNIYDVITNSGTYSMTFDISDSSSNILDQNTNIQLTITT